MTSPITFEAVPGPEDNDVADGVKAFNDLAIFGERNFDILNAWAPQIADLYAAPAITTVGTAMFTPAAGWGWTSDFASRTFARTWLGMVYIYVLLTRTGAAIPASGRGNTTDQDIGYLNAAYKPPATFSGVCTIGNTFTGQCYVLPTGTLRLQGLSYAATIPTNSFLIFETAWPLPLP